MMSQFVCFGQDVVTFNNGESIKAKVTEVSKTEIKYLLFDNQEGPIYTKPVSDIFSITYENGKSEKFQTSVVFNNYSQNQKNYYADAELHDRLRRLKGWSTFLKIYGWIGVASGTICLIAGCNYDYDPYYDDIDYGSYYTTLGTLACIEGGVCLAVGYSLQGKRNRLMKENNLVSSVPVLQKEFKLDNCTIAPSVNLMSCNGSAAQGVGTGISIRF